MTDAIDRDQDRGGEPAGMFVPVITSLEPEARKKDKTRGNKEDTLAR